MSDSICPICEEPLPENNGCFYFEDGIKRSTCKRCVSGLMHIVLQQKLRQWEKGDPRLLLRRDLGVEGKYNPVTPRTK